MQTLKPPPLVPDITTLWAGGEVGLPQLVPAEGSTPWAECKGNTHHPARAPAANGAPAPGDLVPSQHHSRQALDLLFSPSGINQHGHSLG